MAANLQQQLHRVQSKALVVSEKYRSLRESHDAARAEISNLKAQLLARDTTIERLRSQLDYLKIASTLGDAAQPEETRAMIADLMREIDRCIADLLD